jgi:RNA polymerase sigma factor FliA
MSVPVTEICNSSSGLQPLSYETGRHPRDRRWARRRTPGHATVMEQAASPAVVCDEKQAAELLALVRRMALRMRGHLPSHVEVNDLAGAGALGLLDALRKFDPSKNVKLESYARHRIRGAMLDGLRSLDGPSRDLRRKTKRLEMVYHEMAAKAGGPVTGPEMAAALGMSLPKWYRTVQELQAAGAEWLLPFGPVNPPSEKEVTLLAAKDEDAFDRCYRVEQKAMLQRAQARLPERQRQILQLYYNQEMTMKQIAERLGLDESRVSQLHAATLVRLRTCVKAMLQPHPGVVCAGAPAQAEAV